MKQFSKFMMVAALGLGLSACDEKKDDVIDVEVDGVTAEITKDNLQNWVKYADQVAALLKKDTEDLLASWKESYEGGDAFSKIFKEHNAGTAYTSATSCIEQIIDGCSDIANEVGTAKIGDPFDLFVSGKTQQALFAVESWFSWHSREDYANNILSIRNSYYGSLDGTVNAASMSKLVESVDPDLDKAVKEKIALAHTAIMAIPNPFRNNINSQEAKTAMTACENLDNVLTNQLKPFFQNLTGHDAEEQAIVEQYVDGVVLPTYELLAQRAGVLYTAVHALAQDPTDNTFKAAAEAWLEAREPWETSEAFLFGPVDALGLDPNMDSWPLDQTAIANHVESGDLSDLSDTDEEGLITEASQNVRGFHTLEFLLFKDGKPRTVDNIE